MKTISNHFVANVTASLLFAVTLAFFFVGCTTSQSPSGANPRIAAPQSTAVLRPGDGLNIAIQGVPDPSNNDVQLDELGMISLPYIGRIDARGKTSSELADLIRQRYVDRKIYRSVDVSVYVTDRFIYVGGEVAAPGRVIWTPDLTLTKAIQSAGGFSLYAKERAVQLTRDQKTYILNTDLARKVPNQDPKLFPGDSINIERSAF